jgi:chromosome segregation ATPase
MSIYDRDYFEEERTRMVKIERSYTEIQIQIEQQQKMLDQLFDLIKLLREERKQLLEKLRCLEEENQKLWQTIEELRKLIEERI